MLGAVGWINVKNKRAKRRILFNICAVIVRESCLLFHGTAWESSALEQLKALIFARRCKDRAPGIALFVFAMNSIF